MLKFETPEVNGLENNLTEVFTALETNNVASDNLCIVTRSTGNRTKEGDIIVKSFVYVDATDDEIIADMDGGVTGS